MDVDLSSVLHGRKMFGKNFSTSSYDPNTKEICEKHSFKKGVKTSEKYAPFEVNPPSPLLFHGGKPVHLRKVGQCPH